MANKQYLFMDEKRNRRFDVFHSSVLFFTHRKNEQLQRTTFTPIAGLGHVSSVKILSKRSGKVEEFFPEGPEKVTRGGGRNIYTMEEEKILEKYFFLNSVEEDISVLFISS